MLHYTYNDKKIPNLLLYTIDGDSLHLSELLNDDYKLLIRFSQLNCSSCIDDIFEGLRQVVNKFPSNKVILIGTYDNQRVFQGKHSKKCTFYTLRFGCSFAAVNTIKPQLL